MAQISGIGGPPTEKGPTSINITRKPHFGIFLISLSKNLTLLEFLSTRREVILSIGIPHRNSNVTLEDFECLLSKGNSSLIRDFN